MFIGTRNPFGGMRLNSLISYPFKRTGEDNITIEPDKQPHIIGDYICLKIGYAQFDIQKGDKMYIKPTDAEILYNLLKHHFGK